jgi:hypothetical protein
MDIGQAQVMLLALCIERRELTVPSRDGSSAYAVINQLDSVIEALAQWLVKSLAQEPADD